METSFFPFSLLEHVECEWCGYVLQSTAHVEQCADCGHAKTVGETCSVCTPRRPTNAEDS